MSKWLKTTAWETGHTESMQKAARTKKSMPTNFAPCTELDHHAQISRLDAAERKLIHWAHWIYENYRGEACLIGKK